MGIGIVKTTLGMAQGKDMKGCFEGITAFKGIPYALPPVGELRWKAPLKAEPWEGVRVFDTYAPMEIQYQAQYMDQLPREAMSEDCLYLNVFTPAKTPEDHLPVYVWMHGGGLTNGASYHSDKWDPYSFAKNGNCVIVAVGHRINIWGFMALPQLSEEQGGKSGNYGVMDLVMAMDWIYENINAFGGDRENITAGGESGGTQKTCLLASIPAGKNRIKRITNSSGLKWRQVPFLTVEEGEKAGLEYLKYCGIDPSISLEELRAMDSWTIHQNVPRNIYPGDIIFDGSLIPEASFHELFDKYLGDVDFINITSQGESNVFAHRGASGAFGSFTGEVPVKDAESFYAFFKERLGDLYDKYDFRNLVKVTDEDAMYQAKLLGSIGAAELASNNHSRNNMVNRLFGCYMKKNHPKARVWSLLWSHIVPGEVHDYGTDRDPEHQMATHCSDSRYVFDTFFITPDDPWQPLDHEYVKIFQKYYANFCRTGDPNGEGLPEWPETGDGYNYLEVKEELVPHRGIGSKVEEMVREYVIREYGIAPSWEERT